MTISEAPPALDIDALAGRLDAASAVSAGLDEQARTALAEHLSALDELHTYALRTIVRTLKDDPAGKPILFELVDDPAVHMVLAMHGLVRPDPVTAVRRVLEQVRPGLQSHGGDVEFDRIEEGTAYVRLSGACNGCSMAAVTMRNEVESAVIAGVPGIVSVQVVPNDPTPTLIPISSLGVRPADAPGTLSETGWTRACGLDEVPLGSLLAVRLAPIDAPAVDAIVVNAAGQFAAYVNACAHQGRRLDDAMVDAVEGTITCAGHGFCFDSASGECLSMPGAQLEPLPLRIDDGHVWVRAVSS